MAFVVVNSENFEQEVLKSSLPFLLEFGAVWCGPCKRMEPELEKLSQEHGKKLRIGKLDVDESSDLAIQYQVMGVPTMILFVNGEVRQRFTGFLPLPRLMEKIGDVVPL